MTYVLGKLFVVLNTIIVSKSSVVNSSLFTTKHHSDKVRNLFAFVHSAQSIIIIRLRNDYYIERKQPLTFRALSSFNDVITEAVGKRLYVAQVTITTSKNTLMSLRFSSNNYDSENSPPSFIDVGGNFDSSKDTISNPRMLTRKRKLSLTSRKENASGALATKIVTMDVVPSASNLHGVVTPESINHLESQYNEESPFKTKKRTPGRHASPKIRKKDTPEKNSNTNLVASSDKNVSENNNIKANKRMMPPDNWEATYSLVEELRSDRTAPCDSDGCEALVNKVGTTPNNQRFQALICLMLSSQTKDAVVGNTIRQMQKDDVLNIESISSMDAMTLNRYICKVGFHNNKTKYIKEVVNILHNNYNDDIPSTAIEMAQALPGVGPKMAYILETVAWKTCSGIGVDTHMHRIFNLLSWCGTNTTTKDPEKTRQRIEEWLPQEKWMDCNLLWVGFGQEVKQKRKKMLQKAIRCSRPKEALRLLKQCGLNYVTESKKYELYDEVQKILSEKVEGN